MKLLCKKCKNPIYSGYISNIDSKYELKCDNEKISFLCLECGNRIEFPRCLLYKDGSCHGFFGCEMGFMVANMCNAHSYSVSGITKTIETKHEFNKKFLENVLISVDGVIKTVDEVLNIFC